MVARKSAALARHANARGWAGGAPSAARGLGSEGIAEGGGELLESGLEAGIDGSHFGVQPEVAARKGSVGAHLDRVEVDAFGCEQACKGGGIHGVRVDDGAAGAVGLGDD